MSERRVCTIVGAVLAIAGCSVSSRSTGIVTRFRGDANDPAGDTAGVADARVARPADLVYAGIDGTDDVVHLMVRFAPGSLDPATTGASFVLDTDLDPATGQPSLGIGADYGVFLSAGQRDAVLARTVTDPGCTTPCRYEPVAHGGVIVAKDQMDVVIPRSAFVGFDGRLNFRVVAYSILEGGRLTVTSDHLPNLPEQFVVVR